LRYIQGILTISVWGTGRRNWWKWFGYTHGLRCSESVFPWFHRSSYRNCVAPNWWFNEQQVHVSWLRIKNQTSLPALLPLLDSGLLGTYKIVCGFSAWL